MSHETTLSFTLSGKVFYAFKVSGQLYEMREEDLADIPTNSIHDESDVENDSSSPLYNSFYANGGSQILMEMCNFNFSEFEHCGIIAVPF